MMMVEYSQIMLMQVCIFQREFWIQEPTKKIYIYSYSVQTNQKSLS